MDAERVLDCGHCSYPIDIVPLKSMLPLKAAYFFGKERAN